MPNESAIRVVVLQGLRLKGFAEATSLAALFQEPEQVVLEQLERAAADGLAVRRDGRLSGWTLTPEGRAENERLLADELEALGLRDAIRSAYERFLQLNGDMLTTCTRWQVRHLDGEQVLNSHDDPAYDRAVIDELARLDEQVQPICAELSARLARFGHYAPRFSTALRRLRAGGHEWFTKPIIESYHTVWFELHEDLLTTLGLERAAEAAQR